MLSDTHAMLFSSHSPSLLQPSLYPELQHLPQILCPGDYQTSHSIEKAEAVRREFSRTLNTTSTHLPATETI